MRIIVLGMGVQGQKRRRVAGDDCVATVDPVVESADYQRLEDVPIESFDAALCCIPDEPKEDVLTYLVEHGKHALVEKPLHLSSVEAAQTLESHARGKNAVFYTAYNHRFEPHFVAMRDLIAQGDLGEVYSCRMFYGNGTARLVRDSQWRDRGAGVLPDLGSHLLDTVAFWFGEHRSDFRVLSSSRFENRAPDHVVLGAHAAKPRIELEMTLVSWRNHFTCDVYAEKGSAHIASLCKWGPSSFTHYQRVMPSGRPPERTVTLTQNDPTWELEYIHFTELVAASAPTDLSTDRWIGTTLNALAEPAIEAANV